MKNNTTELVFILDRSGSMTGLESDTIGGFNSMIKKQKTLDGKCYVTTVLFDHESITLHDRVSLEKIEEMSEEDYVTRGSTALIDALGKTIDHISNIHKYARKEDIPESTMFVITTDGMENASHEFSSKQVKKLIEEKKKKGWEFLFIGANIDAVETASHYGISSDRAVTYAADAKGTEVLYDNVEKTISSFRKSRKISADWSSEINEDCKSRK